MNKSFLKKLRPVSFGASMADMALLLLIFFMTSTTTEPPGGVEVELPTAKVQGADQDTLYVTISKEGDIYLDGAKVSSSDFASLLDVRYAEKDRTVSITADKSLDYSTIRMVLEILQDREFFNVVFMSEPRKGSGGS